ncbi:aminotransferase class III-fold pyridoxal phosphate-dependent enzyme [Nocardia sp. CDC159]|uniref:Aminotransferase class III-fold pyridoxal phosphate-dependent enzyme n=2 Tax=Nocardiaceae TaxID=85025 RepID=A0A9X2EBE5_9NOCA|nr:aminotransferase class III-fold pyridoxal phosphate-dependent enzyme [Nocardia pulmonis]MCM6788794.1 aminotransferase class III-fold pyridoxal phosphate-dependent enzyme [Nocardia sp. CDC159]
MWQAISAGADSTTEPPSDRWPEQSAGTLPARGGYLDDIESFDNEWFGISVREAEMMDPQQRLALTVAIEALDDAGVAGFGRGTDAAVLMGVSTFDHGAAVLGRPGWTGPYTVTGANLSIVANRLSYVLDLHGPSMVVDSACSASLSAVDLACSLLCDPNIPFVVVGGVNALLLPHTTRSFLDAGFLAADGRCKTFDAAADGYARAEGCVVLVLRRSADAMAAGDRVYAEIVGSSVNSNGRSSALYAPNGSAQQRVITAAWQAAGCPPRSASYFECHGTGTSLGDAIEVSALARVLGADDPGGSSPRAPVVLGSVKSNIGHLEAAAGVAGLAKAALMIHHAALPPSANFVAASPLLRLGERGFRVATGREPMAADPLDRIVGVSSFGFGGTNAHVVVRGMRSHPASRPDRAVTAPPRMVISAADRDLLRATAGDWVRWLDEHPRHDLADAVEISRRVTRDGVRAGVIATDRVQARDALAALAAGAPDPRVIVGPDPSTARRSVAPLFLFPGQGGQFAGMGRELADAFPRFAEAAAEAAEAVRAAGGPEVWNPDHGFALGGTHVVQPALFAFQVASAALLAGFGIHPGAVVGHSLGEVAAAHTAGLLDLTDAAKVAVARGTVLGRLDGTGSMAVLELDVDDAHRRLRRFADRVAVAAVNSPRAVVVSGQSAAVRELVAEVASDGVFAREIAVDFAAHSPAVAARRGELLAAFGALNCATPKVPMLSTTRPGADPDELIVGAEYWADNACDTVQLHAALQQAVAEDCDVVVEIGPHPVLAHAVLESAAEFRSVLALSAKGGESLAAARCLAELDVAGYPVRWPAGPGGFGSPPRRRWRPTRFVSPWRRAGDPAADDRPEREIDCDITLFADHVVAGESVVPAARWMLAVHDHAAGMGMVVQDLVVHERLETEALRSAQVLLRPAAGDRGPRTVNIVLARGTARTTIVTATIAPLGQPVESAEPIAGRGVGDTMSPQELYERLRRSGVDYGPRFRAVRQIACGAGRVVATVDTEDAAKNRFDRVAIIDSCMQPLLGALDPAWVRGRAVVPISVGEIRLGADFHGDLTLDGVVTAVDGDLATARVRAVDATGAQVVTLRDLRLRAVALPGWYPTGALFGEQWIPLSGTAIGHTGAVHVVGAGPNAEAVAAGLAGERAAVHRIPVSLTDGTAPAAASEIPAGSHVVAVLAAPHAAETTDSPVVSELSTAMDTIRTLLADRSAAALVLTLTDAAADTMLGSGLIGMLRTVALEYAAPVGIVRWTGDPAERHAVGSAVRHCMSDAHNEIRVCDGAVTVRRLRPVVADRHPRPDPGIGGCVVVVGGGGGLGTVVIDYLLEQGARQVISLQRSAVAAAADPRIVRISCDARDRADLEAVLGGVRDRYGRITAVVHAAGTLVDAEFSRVTHAMVRELWESKLGIASNLVFATRADPPDIMVVLSSASGTIGSPGQSAYALVNAALDAFARQCARSGRRIVSLALGAVDGVGLAYRRGGAAHLARAGMPALEPAAVRQLLGQAWRCGATDLTAVAYSPTAVSDALGGRVATLLGSSRCMEPRVDAADGPDRDLPAAVHAVVASAVGRDVRAVSRTATFADLGVDSLLAIEIRRRLESALSVRLSTAEIFAHPTVDRLTTALLAKLGPADPEPAIEAPRRTRTRSVAVRGIGLRVPPDIRTVHDFWAHLLDRADSVGRVAVAADGSRALATATAPPAGFGALLDVSGFDHAFFGISATESEQMDPQQRLALETTWEALRDAGIDPVELAGTGTGVFVGAYANDWMLIRATTPESMDAFTGPGSAHSMVANRVSYALDVHGPSMTVDTACSSGATALSAAVHAIRAGQCDTAVVIGVHVVLSDFVDRLTRSVLPFSAARRCRSFDAEADGIVRAEGCIAVVLQGAAATAGAMPPRGHILGVGINHGGRANGLTAPNPVAQQQVLRAALADAGVSAAEVGYIEAHGAGTALGDPIEMMALREVYGGGERDGAIGSLKANFGHAEAAAGLLGLVKALLVADSKIVPAQPNFANLNPDIELSGTGLRIAIEQGTLASSAPLAAVSSFGFGGTNVHVIVAGPDDPRVTADRSQTVTAAPVLPDAPLVLPLAAADFATLEQLRIRYLKSVTDTPAEWLREFCRNAAVRDGDRRARSAWVAHDRAELIDALRRPLPDAAARPPDARPLVFVYSGQGTAWPTMAAGVFDHPAIAPRVADWDAAVRRLCGWSLIDAATSAASGVFESTVTSQICTAAVQLALTALLRQAGAEPDAVIGHSMGEAVAAVAAGVFDASDMFALLADRGRVIDARAGGGAMIAARCTPEQAARWIEDRTDVAIAAVNSPNAVVFTGIRTAIESLSARLRRAGVRTRDLGVGYAFHGPLLADARVRWNPDAEKVSTLPFFSTVTGDRYRQRFDAEYWTRNLREPVRFSDAVRAVRAALGEQVLFLEVGPHSVLAGALTETLGESTASGSTVVSTMIRGRPFPEAMADSMAGLHDAGVSLDWPRIIGSPTRRLPLPSYPWARRASRPETPHDHQAFDASPRTAARPSRRDVAELLCAELNQVLGPHTTVTAATPLWELDIESLHIVRIRARMSARLGIDVRLSVLLSGTTVDAIAEAVLAELPEVAPAQMRDDTTTAAAQTVSERRGFAEHMNSHLARILTALKMDREYVRGAGTVLTDAQGRTCLDFAGAYGALPFGHGPERIWDAVRAVERSGEAIFAQPSVLTAAGTLAERLAAVAPPGLTRVTFVNSGAEAIEAAVKIARSATGRLGVLSTANGFHGKTLGALSATGRDTYQLGFGAPANGFERIRYGDAAALRETLRARPDHFAVFLVEPIQGEGGVIVPPPSYLTEIRAICDEFGVLLALDEVQTGLGRTGRLFAAEHEGVVPDIMTLAKALGGGIVPIGAVLTKPEHITENFALRHTSTFAGNALAARVGIAVLEELTRHDRALVRAAVERGDWLLTELRRLRRRFPALVVDVRGRGLLLGVELTSDVNYAGFQGLLGSVARQENLAMMICSYLLDVEHIRLAPTLFGTTVLRVEPPLTVTAQECERFVLGLERALALAAAGDFDGLLGHLAGRTRDRSAAPVAAPRPARPPLIAPAAGDRRFGFVAHPLDLRRFEDFDPALAGYSHAQRRELLDRLARAGSVLNPVPFVVGSGRIRSATGTSAYGELIGLPYTARDLLDLPRAAALRYVREAIELGVERGAELIGLGAYSSIVTANGVDLGTTTVPITTGNGFTAAASVAAIRSYYRARGRSLADSRVAIIGAGGAIGRAIARQLAPDVGSMVLSGRRGTAAPDGPLGAVAAEIAAVARSGAGMLAAAVRSRGPNVALPEGILRLGDNPAADIAGADIVVAATSAPQPLVAASDFAPHAVVCDVAQPPNVPADVATLRPDVTVFDGGIVRYPPGSDFDLRYGLPPGLTYACMAETMLLALSGDSDPASVGNRLSDKHIRLLGELAAAHGFELAEARMWRSPDLDLVGDHHD